MDLILGRWPERTRVLGVSKVEDKQGEALLEVGDGLGGGAARAQEGAL